MIVNEALLDRAREIAARFLRSLPTRHVGPTRRRATSCWPALDVPLTDDGEDPAAVLDALARRRRARTDRQRRPALLRLRHRRQLARRAGGGLADQRLGPERRHLRHLAGGVGRRRRRARMAARAVRPAAQRQRRIRRPAARWRTSPASPRRATRVLRRAGWNVEENGLAGAPRVHIVVSAEAHITIHSRAAHARLRHARAASRSTPTSRGGCAPTRCATLLRELDGPIDRLRAGRQREHRRRRSAARHRRDRPRARRLAARRRRLRPVGPRQRAPRARCSTASSWPTRGPTTRTSG